MKRAVQFRDADRIAQQARRIMWVAEQIVDACKAGTTMDAYARNKVTSGGLAADAAQFAF